MKQSVHISGITCGNCLASVKEKLATIEGISVIEVDLPSGNGSWEIDQLQSIEALEQLLGKKYSVSFVQKTTAEPSKWKQIRPLLLILGYVFGGSLLLAWNQDISVFMRFFMGLFYIVFGLFKFLDYRGFPASFSKYDPLSKKFPFYAWCYPFIETFLGLCFLLQWKVRLAAWITLFILGSTTIGVLQKVMKKDQIQCACVGTALKLPMTEATLIENALMLVMAVGMLIGI